ncbi:MAG TPA: DedA family protein [Chloroflexi bacterium]|nr:DedA family protein [Chloroflexota bacterium]
MKNPSPEATSLPETAEPQPFGVKHIISILSAVAITLLIVIFRDQLRELERLSYGGAFLAMLIGNATLVLPVPGLIFVFALGGTLNPLLVGLAAGPGAALGEMTGYLAGYGGSAVIHNFRLYHRIEGWMDRYGLIVIAVLAAIPNPVFDVAGIIAGVMRIKWWHFLIAAWIGKTLQAIFIAYAGALSLGWVESLLH